MTDAPRHTQKELARALDRCADRAEFIDRTPATGKQCWYLAHLILQSGDDCGEYFTDSSLVLTKQKASHLIEVYKH